MVRLSGGIALLAMGVHSYWMVLGTSFDFVDAMIVDYAGAAMAYVDRALKISIASVWLRKILLLEVHQFSSGSLSLSLSIVP